MTDFDPDAYLTQSSDSKAFDPDTYLSQKAPESSEAPSQWSLSNLGRQAGLAGRAVIQGVTALPAMAADVGVAGRNLYENLSKGVMPTLSDFNPLSNTGPKSPQTYELPSQSFNRALTQAGFPEPQNTTEAVTGALESGLAGSRLPAPVAGEQAPSNFVSPQKGLTPAQQQALEQGTAIGMKATPGQASGSKPLQQIEASLESNPWTSSPANAAKANNAAILNRSWAKAIGEDSNTVDSTTLARANDRLGEVFDSVRDARPRQIDPTEFTQQMSKIESDFEGLLPGGGIADHKLVQRLMSYAESGQATGEQLGGLTSKLGKAATREMSSPGGDREMGQALYQVKDYVDDLVSKGLSPEEASNYNTARQQYRSLMQLTSRVNNVNPSTGNVSGASMASFLQKSDKQGYLYGKNQSDPYAATRFAQAFKPIVGDSGTATRTSLNLANMAALPLSVPANLLSRAYYKGLLTPGLPDQRTLSSLSMGAVGANASQ